MFNKVFETADIEMVYVSYVLFRFDGRFLLLQRAKQVVELVTYKGKTVDMLVDNPYPYVWTPPGGKFEKDKDGTVKDAAIRELKEETNIYADQNYDYPNPDRLVGVATFQTPSHNNQAWLFNVFLLEHLAGPCDVVLNQEHIGYGWFTWEELRAMRALPTDRLDEQEATEIYDKIEAAIKK